jgi:hypothetical protein
VSNKETTNPFNESSLLCCFSSSNDIFFFRVGCQSILRRCKMSSDSRGEHKVGWFVGDFATKNLWNSD